MNGKVLLKHSKYGVPIIIFLSIIPQFYYYSIFNIDLGSYISIVEVPMLFAKELLWLTFISILPYLIVVSLMGKEIGTKNTDNLIQMFDKPFKQRFYQYVKDSWLGFFLVLNSLICYFIRFDYIFLYTTLIALISVTFSIYLREVVVRNKIIVDQEYSTILNSSYLLLICLMMLIANASLKARTLKKDSAEKSITIITSKQTFFCKYNMQYIGRTREYTFIYDQKRGRTEVLKNSEILTEKIESD